MTMFTNKCGRKRPTVWVMVLGALVFYEVFLTGVMFKTEFSREISGNGSKTRSHLERQLQAFIQPKHNSTKKSHDASEQFGTFNTTKKGPDAPEQPRQLEKLQYKLQRLAHATGKHPESLEDENSKPLWELSDYAPQWMKDYFAWHKEARRRLSEDGWEQQQQAEENNHKFLVVQCMQVGDEDPSNSCGSLTERMLLLPYWLRVAHESHRILFLHWTEPAELHNYLDSPSGGFDWRAPATLERMLNDKEQGVLIRDQSQFLSEGESLQKFNDVSLVRIQIKYTQELEDQYCNIDSPSDREDRHSSLATVFHDVWRIFFVPSKHVIAEARNVVWDNPNMKVGDYTTIDLRALPDETRNETARKVVESCSQDRPQSSSFVVTKDLNVTVFLQQEMGNTAIFARYKTRKLRHRKAGKPKELRQQSLMDLDATEGPAHLVESYYDIFVNLFLMSMGNCVVTYSHHSVSNRNTLSRLGTLIGYGNKCYFQYDDKDDCYSLATDMPVTMPETHAKRAIPKRFEHHFSAPMVRDGSDEFITSVRHGNETESVKPNFPPWLKEYLGWHKSTKSKITLDNWKSTKYLILSCMDGVDFQCGGISDRLKPLPMIIWEAYQSERLLLIWWDRPKPLEEWLVPPDGGVDWTVSPDLRDEMIRSIPHFHTKRYQMFSALNWEQGKALRQGATSKTVILYRLQEPDAGENLFFDEQALYAKKSKTIRASYTDIYHHLWREFFTPAPRLAKVLESKFHEHGLVPGHYPAVHLRAMYGKRDHRDPQETSDLAVLGVNCASNLLPGAPVFFASDTSFAVESARAYQRLHQQTSNITVVSLDSFGHKNQNSNPIHLDKDPDWKTRPAEAYDSTFVDLYMLAESRCVAYSNGGYGTFGSILSHDPNCKMRFFKANKKVKHCQWMDQDRKRIQLQVPNATNVLAYERTE